MRHPVQLTEKQLTRLSLAEWHARESIGKELAGQWDAAAYHLEAAGEFLALAYGQKWRVSSFDDVIAAVETIRVGEMEASQNASA